MPDSHIIYKEKQVWKGKTYITEYINSTDFTSIHPITQVQAICIDQNGNYVLYRNKEGMYGLPGGTVENETLEEALYREIAEEVACKVLDYKPLLYVRNTNPPEDPIQITYQVRYVAHVAPFSDHVNDPAGKSIKRIIVNNESDLKRLVSWGKKLDVYLDAAHKAYV